MGGITKLLKGVSNLFFLGKEHIIVGNKTVKQLNEEVLALGRKKTILSVNDQTVTNNNTTATQNNTAMNANANSLQYQTQIIHRVGSFVSDTNATITLDNTKACETTVRAQATSSGALNMQNGVNIQN